MPRTPTDYSNTIIYKIQSIDNPELLYVGSTTDFTKRKSGHKSECGNPRKNHKKVYTMINQNGGWSMFNMVELYKFPCENKRQAECEEDRCIRGLKSTLNSQRAFVTPDDIAGYRKQHYEKHKEQVLERAKEYYERNKEKVLKYQYLYYNLNKEQIVERGRRYREENKEQIAENKKKYSYLNRERIAEQRKLHYQQNKEEISEKSKRYQEQNKEKISERYKHYYEQNKEQIVERVKHYREQNKERIAEQKKQKMTCECGCVILKRTLAQHKRTKKHQDLIKSIEQ